jgi:nucleoside-diphosphate-sugar epimerase
MSATKRIIVFGGNGFVGSRICRAAVARNWDVTSIRYVPVSGFGSQIHHEASS